MKRLAQILFVLALCAPAFADEAEVIFTPRLATHRPLTNVLITIRPLSVPSSDGVGEITVNAITNRTGTSTNYTTTLYTPGTYEISYVCTNPLYRTVFTNDFPNTNGTVYSRDFISVSVNVSGLLAYSKAQSDARFALRTNAFSMISTSGTRLAFGGITNINWTTGVTGYVSGATAHLGVTATGGGGGSGDSGGTNARQFGSLNLTNWSTIPTGSMANIPAVTFLTNWTTAISNYVDTASSNRVRVAAGTGGITVTPSGSGGVMTFTISDDDAGSGGSDAGGTNSRQFGSLNLTNWSNIPTGAMANIPAVDWSTNRHAAAITNNHSVAVSLKTNLNVSGSNMVRALVVTNNAEIGGNLTAVGFTNTGNTLLTMDFRLSSSDFTGTDTFIGRSGATAKIVSKPLYQDLTSSNLAGIHNSTAAGTNFARVFEGTSDTDESALSISNGYFRGRLNVNNLTITNVAQSPRALMINAAGNVTNVTSSSPTTEYVKADGSVGTPSGSGSSSFNTTNLYVTNSGVFVADLANFDRLKVYAISNGTVHLSNAASFLKRGRALIQNSTNGGARIAWSVPGGLLQTNGNIGNNTNANALDVLEFEQAFFDTNLFAWWPSNFMPRVAYTNVLGTGGGGGGGSDPDLLWWKLNDSSGGTITADVGPNGTTDGTLNSDYLALNGTSQEAFTSSAINYGVNTITVSVWVYVADWSAASENVIFESGANYGAGPARFIFNFQAAGVNAMIYQSGGGRIENFNAGAQGLVNNTWYHFAIVFDNSTTSGVVKVYRDGASVTTTPADGKSASGNFATEVLNIGSRNQTESWLGGRVDDLRIYSGELDSTAIGNIYTAGRQ